jgi:hypothetical protein
VKGRQEVGEKKRRADIMEVEDQQFQKKNKLGLEHGEGSAVNQIEAGLSEQLRGAQ